MQMAEGGEAQVTWPANPVGVGSRGHKPAPNTQARRSPTPPTPLSARLTAKAPPALPVEPRSTVHPMSQSQLLRHGLELAQPSRAISLQPSTAPQLPISHPAPAPAAGPSQPLVSAALTPLLQSSQQAVVGPPDSITTQARFSVDNAQTASAAHTALTPTSALPASAPAGDAAEPSQRLMAAAHQPDNRLASAASGEPGSTALADTNPQAEASKQHAEAEAAVNHAVACCSEVHHNGADMLKQDDHLARDNALASDQPHGALPLNVADFNGVTGRLRPASPDIGFHGEQSSHNAAAQAPLFMRCCMVHWLKQCLQWQLRWLVAASSLRSGRPRDHTWTAAPVACSLNCNSYAADNGICKLTMFPPPVKAAIVSSDDYAVWP